MPLRFFPEAAFADLPCPIPVIAGPCSIESREQIRETMRRLLDCGYKVVRAGAWKPRTLPGGFEGVGEIGLEWMREVADELGMWIGTEVCLEEHARAALRHRCDFVWLGARTTSSPFMVERIAVALSEAEDKPAVLVKNLIAPDFRLWRGAIERLRRHGLTKIVAVNRGFNLGYHGLLRNDPLWEEVDHFRSELPDLPFLCDPSHICGRCDLLPEIVGEALRRSYDGLFIESHTHPDSALTDAAQQITPEAIAGLIPDQPRTGSGTLTTLRSEVDRLDDALIHLLARRQALTKQIGEWKHTHGLAPYQPDRFEELLRDCSRRASLYGLHEEPVQELFTLIHRYSLATQEEEEEKKHHL